MRNTKLVYVFEDLLVPKDFSLIIRPFFAIHNVTYSPEHLVAEAFGGLHQHLNTFNYVDQQDRDLRELVAGELRTGRLVAISTYLPWSGVSSAFYVDTEGKLIIRNRSDERYFDIDRIIRRYEEMVKHFGHRPPPTNFPPALARTAPEQKAQAAKRTPQTKEAVPTTLTKAQRWQERKYLIGRGQRSIYPDARIAADRLAQNNVAVEKAKLAENVYKTTNPLKDTPGVPEGWKDISNNDNALDSLGLKRNMLFDNAESPDFLARIYQPDSSIFGKDMNPTVVFRGSRAPEFAEGTRETINKFLWEDVSAIKDVKINNLADWSNNFSQGVGRNSEFYRKAVDMGRRLQSTTGVDLSGHSLGGGLASAASIASGKQAWTFNAAGLNAGTVEKYGGSVIGSAKNIQAYRVEGELLTKLQEVNLWEDAKDVYFNPSALAAKEGISKLAPDAAGITHTLPGGAGSLLDKHGIDQAIKLIEDEKDEDIATIRGRI